MKITPVGPYIPFLMRFKNNENNMQQSKRNKRGLEDINPSFKYYMATCQPIKPQISFTGHGPYQYKLDSVSPIFDVNGMIFPLTHHVVPSPNGNTPGHLNYLA